MNTKPTLALAGKLITKRIILYLLSYLLYCTFRVYQSGPTINKVLASARNKNNSLSGETIKNLIWLGISVNLNKGCLYVSKERISNLLENWK